MKEVDVVCKHKPVDNCQLPPVLGEINFYFFLELIHCAPVPGYMNGIHFN